MRLLSSTSIKKLTDLLTAAAPPPEQMAQRLTTLERDIILPVKGVFLLILLYNLYFSRWFEDVALPRSVAQESVERFFLFYLLANIVVAALVIMADRFRPSVVEGAVFAMNFLDGLFLAALTFVTGGFDSILYWLFVGLIVRNAMSSPLVVPQLILNLSASFFYLCAGLLDVAISDDMLDYDELSAGSVTNPTEPLLLRLIVLGLTTACCYGVQVLFEKQRRAEEETREFVVRQEQLRSAGRLAAQIAHQIKNPLGIINNAAYSLQRALRQNDQSTRDQVDIIREEIERADAIITTLMGYARLAEGEVERLDLAGELDRAIQAVFPPAANYSVQVETQCAPDLPPLLMQKGHLQEILVNILQNAREATEGVGQIRIQASLNPDNAVIIRISDDGPGIPADRLEKVFQPYFTTKRRGTGLGLAIVRQNVEIYRGSVRAESELGKGTSFIVEFPTRTFMKPVK